VATGFQEMGTLRCDSCGEEFIVFHDFHKATFADKKAAERQAQCSKGFLPRNTNGNGSTRIESNCLTSSRSGVFGEIA